MKPAPDGVRKRRSLGSNTFPVDPSITLHSVGGATAKIIDAPKFKAFPPGCCAAKMAKLPAPLAAETRHDHDNVVSLNSEHSLEHLFSFITNVIVPSLRPLPVMVTPRDLH